MGSGGPRSGGAGTNARARPGGQRGRRRLLPSPCRPLTHMYMQIHTCVCRSPSSTPGSAASTRTAAPERCSWRTSRRWAAVLLLYCSCTAVVLPHIWAARGSAEEHGCALQRAGRSLRWALAGDIAAARPPCPSRPPTPPPTRPPAHPQTLKFSKARDAGFKQAAFEGSTHYALEGRWLAAQMRDVFPWLRLREWRGVGGPPR